MPALPTLGPDVLGFQNGADLTEGPFFLVPEL
jgi:hypothetical protein